MESKYSTKAIYKEQVIEEYKNNPLIEALEKIRSPEDVISLSNYPDYSDSERYAERHIRLHMLQKIFRVFQILPFHIDLESRISRVIRHSYLPRNPLTKEVKLGYAKKYEAIKSDDLKLINNDYYNSTGFGFSIIGVSGIGKTTSLYKVLPKQQIIIHSEYKTNQLSLVQLVWLKIECPFDGSVSSLTKNFFKSVDDLIGTDYQKKYCNGRFSTSTRIPAMAVVASNINLGMLIIDEIQFLNGSKSRAVLQFITTLVNEIGIPIILIGIPSAANLLQRDFKTARRMSGQGDMIVNRLKNDKEWNLFLNAIWKYQWIREKIELTTELSNVLYDECQGVIDLCLKLFAMTQAYSINTGKETLTPAMIRKVSREQFKLIQPMLSALKSGDIKRIASFEDISTVNINIGNMIKEKSEVIKYETRLQELIVAEKREKTLDHITRKEKTRLKLNSIGKGTKKAIGLIDKYLIDQSSTPNDIVMNILEELSKPKEKKTGDIEMDKDDIRNIILKGKDNNKTNYESLLEASLISKVSFEDGMYFI